MHFYLVISHLIPLKLVVCRKIHYIIWTGLKILIVLSLYQKPCLGTYFFKHEKIEPMPPKKLFEMTALADGLYQK